MQPFLNDLALMAQAVVFNIYFAAASIPIALDEAWRAGRVQKGDVIIFVAFGAGLTWANAVVRV